jgi:hypothetical protein
MHDAVILQLFKICLETLDVDNCIGALAVLVAAQRKRDIVRIRDGVAPELRAGDLRDVDGDLGLSVCDHKAEANRA